MKKALVSVLAAIVLMFATTAAASTILVSATGALQTANSVVELQFVYNSGMGAITIQSYGYGGSANAPNAGRTASGVLIPAGGFDTIVGLFSGPIGGGGARLFFNDDGFCGPGRGATDAGICFDSTILPGVLASGTYTVSLSVFSNFPPAFENGAYPGGGSFNGRTGNWALDVTAENTVPEPGTVMLLTSGLLAVGVAVRRKLV